MIKILNLIEILRSDVSETPKLEAEYKLDYNKGGVNLAKSGFFGSGIERKTRTKVRSLFHWSKTWMQVLNAFQSNNKKQPSSIIIILTS